MFLYILYQNWNDHSSLKQDFHFREGVLNETGGPTSCTSFFLEKTVISILRTISFIIEVPSNGGNLL